MKLSWNGDEIANMSFRDDVRKQNLRVGKLSASKTKNKKNKNKSNLSRSSTATSMLQLNCNVLTCYNDAIRTLFAQCTQPKYGDLSTNNMRRCWSWILLWQYYLSLPDIGMYFSVNTMREIWYGIGMEVWKIVFHSILEIFHSIPFWHLPYSIPKFPFHSILFSIPYHALSISKD